MKKICKISRICICLVWVLLMSIIMVDTSYAATQSGDYQYEVLEDGTASIERYKGADTSVVVPEEIDGYVVSTIGRFAFEYNKTIQEVTIPQSVKVIKEQAFHLAETLKKVTFTGDGLQKIEDEAFNGTAIQEFNFPATVTEVGKKAFASSKLKSIMIPGSVTTWGETVFWRCTELETVEFEEGAKIVPERMFSDCESLKKVTLSSTVEEIKEDSLSTGETIDEIILPEGLKKIESDVLYSTTVNKLVANCKNTSIAGDAFSEAKIKNLYCYYDSTFYERFKKKKATTITFIGNPMVMTKTSMTVGVGSTTALELIAQGNIKWETSNKKVATVNSKGVVTAKKKGKVTITATCDDGKKAYCKITIKNNERKKLESYSKKPSKYEKNIAGFGFSKIARDSKGNYIISGHFLNNYGKKGSYLRNFTITVYKDGKKIAKQKYSKLKVNAPAHSMKPIKIKIKKSKITKKTTDLRNGKITLKVSGGILY